MLKLNRILINNLQDLVTMSAIKNQLKTMKGVLALSGRDSIAAATNYSIHKIHKSNPDDLQQNKRSIISINI